MCSSIIKRLIPALCACALALTLSLPTGASGHEVTILVNGTPLAGDVSPYIRNGTAYVSLTAFAAAQGDYNARWDGTSALVDGPSLTLRAQPGQSWVEANDRALYVPHGVQLNQGRTMIPIRTAAAMFGLDVAWDGRTNTVHVTGVGQPLVHADAYYDPDTMYWLARVISAESQGEPLVGQIAVGNVVLNRLNSPVFPNSLYEVIFQAGQFEPVANGTIYQDPYHLSVLAAKLCLEGAQVVGDCLYFFAPALSTGSWIVNNRTYHTTIGCHQFYL